MTKRDYLLIANVLAKEVPFKTNRLQVAEALANAFAMNNPRFDRERFFRAAEAQQQIIGDKK